MKGLLLPTRYSDALRAWISQMVDLDWGKQLLKTSARYLSNWVLGRLKLFANNTSDFVPLPRSRKVVRLWPYQEGTRSCCTDGMH